MGTVALYEMATGQPAFAGNTSAVIFVSCGLRDRKWRRRNRSHENASNVDD